MRYALLLLTVVTSACENTASLEPPLPSGEYSFAHRHAERPDIPSIQLTVQIHGGRIVLINSGRTDVFPAGLIEEGTLMWHASSAQWIIGSEAADAEASDVGGCSDGPSVVDLQRRIYWTC